MSEAKTALRAAQVARRDGLTPQARPPAGRAPGAGAGPGARAPFAPQR